jgi:hypothetical protein
MMLEPATAVRPAAVPVRNLRRDLKVFPPGHELKAVLSKFQKAYLHITPQAQHRVHTGTPV